ncbi:hypothetical protein FSBG_00792 [Fusobacterium gonidiaformans 3-1-5R]|uniref:DUF997 domain-containing protein n=2 Tax=Fusobacterium TaxID=848 RepID=E5BE19_9FUSO|nr:MULTISPECIES: YhdT family protein [Fusobacterium]AVQ17394.1 DUF997 domain-containing protein [Fusobacterium gonidiaformans ATCC 25563]EFS21295.1 hypothetical protein FSBG_00792 [Fusobacterium gonidiaformans 3-1-5R]EFS27830.1 hypothetical protein FGAG_00151 [Fusobacterium gonidiaformans ATCC 25563]KXA15574.1 hypothetical protein HMPREF3206_00660 [Fusobacterium equinum]
MKSKRKQINKEALLTVGMYLVYFVWWYYFAYCFGEEEVSQYHYILGLPEWFFYSCVLGLVVMNVLVFFVIKFFFQDMDLEEEDKKC